MLSAPSSPTHLAVSHRPARFATWLALAAESNATAPPAYVEQVFRRYRECGILANGFARAFCKECGHDFLVAFSCQGRAVCPSGNARRMVATAAHRSDHVLPPLPLRQWVLAVPKRLRYFRHDDPALQGVVVRILLRAIERWPRQAESRLQRPESIAAAMSVCWRDGSLMGNFRRDPERLVLAATCLSTHSIWFVCNGCNALNICPSHRRMADDEKYCGR